MIRKQQQGVIGRHRWALFTSVVPGLLCFASVVVCPTNAFSGHQHWLGRHQKKHHIHTSSSSPTSNRVPVVLASTTGSFSPFSNKNKNNPTKKSNKNNKEKSIKKKPKNELYSSEARQLLGVKVASSTTSSFSNTAAAVAKWKIRLQLTKPVTWVPLSMIVMCGAAASGNYHWIWNPWNPADRDVALGLHDAALGLVTVILAGPFSEGFAQTINDWYDREIDAINEPYRPIPSGKISQEEVFQQLWFLFLGGLTLAISLDNVTGHFQDDSFPIVTAITLFGYFVSYIYSAPPLKLKQNGWAGDVAIGTCYISLPWWVGQSIFGHLDRPESWIIPLVYSMVGLGAGIVNDFKSIEGDKAFGLKSIPILLGVQKAKWLAALIPDAVQISIAAYLYSIGETNTAACLLALVLPQVYLQQSLLLSPQDPSENDVQYMTMTQPLVMLGVIATALCLGQHQWPAS